MPLPPQRRQDGDRVLLLVPQHQASRETVADAPLGTPQLHRDAVPGPASSRVHGPAQDVPVRQRPPQREVEVAGLGLVEVLREERVVRRLHRRAPSVEHGQPEVLAHVLVMLARRASLGGASGHHDDGPPAGAGGPSW